MSRERERAIPCSLAARDSLPPTYPQPLIPATFWILCPFWDWVCRWNPAYQQKFFVQCFAYSASISCNSSAKSPMDFMYLGHHAPVDSGTSTATIVVVSPLQTVRC